MGPRPFGRGEVWCCRTRCPPSMCFNGAATFRPRRAIRPGRRGTGPPASMGPRPFGRGELSIRLCPKCSAMLQWGRDLSAAESSRWYGYAVQSDNGFNGAATFRPRRANPPGTRTGCSRRFNGAATFRPRRAAMRYPLPLATVALQWGRDLSAAERSEVHTWPLQHTYASMGPRPFGRGEQRREAKQVKENYALQWGRDLSAAERR